MARAHAGLSSIKTVENQARLRSVPDYLGLLSDFIASRCPEDAVRYLRIAQNRLRISTHAPQSFEQTVQLFYFACFVSCAE